MFEPFFILFSLMAIGYGAMKRSWINETQNQGLGNVLINIAFPCLLFASIINVNIEGELLRDFLKAGILSFIFYALFCFLGGIYAKVAGLPVEHHAMVKMSMFTSNNSFMGFPIVLAFFGQQGFILMVANNIAMAFMTFGYGISMLKKSRRLLEGRDDSKKNTVLMWMQQIFNPIIISVFLALVVNFMGLAKFISPPLFSLLSMLGDLTTPLSMIYIGATLATSPLKDLARDRAAFGVSLTRLLLFSATIFGILWFLPVSVLIKQILFLVYVLPSAAVIPALTEKYGVGHKEAVNIVVLSTLFSLITSPSGVYIALNFLGG